MTMYLPIAWRYNKHVYRLSFAFARAVISFLQWSKLFADSSIFILPLQFFFLENYNCKGCIRDMLYVTMVLSA